MEDPYLDPADLQDFCRMRPLAPWLVRAIVHLTAGGVSS
jgi:hypothetical protein